MFYSASIQRLSGVLLHELSRSASSLFIIATLSFWVVNYWFCLSLCRTHGHKYYTVFVLQGRVRAFWEVVVEILKRAPCPCSNFYCPHSGVSHNSANKIPCQGTHIYLSYVCTHTFAFSGLMYLNTFHCRHFVIVILTFSGTCGGVFLSV